MMYLAGVVTLLAVAVVFETFSGSAFYRRCTGCAADYIPRYLEKFSISSEKRRQKVIYIGANIIPPYSPNGHFNG